MRCVRGGLADCKCHPTGHAGFLRYTWLMDVQVGANSEDHEVKVSKHPLGFAGTVYEANDAHAGLDRHPKGRLAFAISRTRDVLPMARENALGPGATPRGRLFTGCPG